MGAEAVRTVVRARRTRTTLAWSSGGGEQPVVVGDARDGTSAHEVAHGLVLPTQIYPMFENALRAKHGRTLDEHQRVLGHLCSGLSAVAAANPHAWFRQARTADEIATVSPSNRMIGFPYPKLMNAIIEVDQAAGVLMTSVATARALGVPRDRWVYLWGSGQAHDRWFVTERVDYTSSPAIREAARQALGAAGIGIDRGSSTWTSTAASRRPCRSDARCSASRRTIPGRSRSPAACRTSAVRATTTRCTRSPR